MKYIFISICLLILASCSSNDMEFSNPFRLNMLTDCVVDVVINDSLLKDPWAISVLDSFIVIANTKGEPVLEVFDFDGNKIEETLSYGKGPNEILCVGNLQPITNSNSLYVVDLFTKKILYLNIDSLVLLKERYLPKQIFSVSDDKIDNLAFTKPIIWGDSMIAHSIKNDGRLVMLENNGKEIGYFGEFPNKNKVNSKMPDYANTTLYSGGATLSPNSKKLAFVTYSAGMMDLFDLSKDGISTTWSNCIYLPVHLTLFQNGDIISLAHTEKAIAGYQDISSNNEYVFAIYSGKQFKDPTYSFANEIHISSWDGKFQYNFHTDNLLSRVAACRNENVIYAISQNKLGAPEVLKFNFSSLHN